MNRKWKLCNEYNEISSNVRADKCLTADLVFSSLTRFDLAWLSLETYIIDFGVMKKKCNQREQKVTEYFNLLFDISELYYPAMLQFGIWI